MKRICFVLTTRGNYGKTKNILKLLAADPTIELQVVLGGMIVLEKYGRLGHLLNDIGVSVSRKLNFVVEGETPLSMVKTSGLALLEFGNVFAELRPDLVVVIADRFECLPISIAATYQNIKLVHIEGGEISGSIDESIRHAITKMSHVHFPATNDAGKRIAAMGECESSIHVVGATSLDVLAEQNLTDLSQFLDYQKLYGIGPELSAKPGEYLVVIQHPVTTEYDENFANVVCTIEAVSRIGLEIFWILPNMDAGADLVNRAIRHRREADNLKTRIRFFKSLPIEIYGPLLANSACLVGNSSSGIRESAFLGVPSVNIGTRQQGRERTENVIDVDYCTDKIVAAIETQISRGPLKPDYTFGDGRASEKIVKVLKAETTSIQKRNSY